MSQPIQRSIPIVLALLIVSGCAPSGLSSDWKRIEPSIQAPQFILAQLSGDPINLSDLRGRIVVLEFWATWCAPCRFSLPSLDTIYRRYRQRGVTVLLINQGESPETVRRWTQARFSSPILLDIEHNIAQLYMISGLPQLFVIDRSGRIAYVHEGYHGGLERSLGLILDEMLGAKSDSYNDR